jgi:hypothetical protein
MLKIISGGQTGADQAALRAAKSLGYRTGGFAPQDFMTTDGPMPALKTEYGLEELLFPTNKVQNLIARSKLNVDNSDATIAFLTKRNSGTEKTCGYCYYHVWKNLGEIDNLENGYKPLLIISDLGDEGARTLIVDFIKRHKPKILNICGHRDDVTAGVKNYEILVEKILISALKTAEI